MLVAMSNPQPGLSFAMIGNPGPRRRRKASKKKSTRRNPMTRKQRVAALKNLRKARAALRKKSRRRNPKAGSKGRRKIRRKQLKKRRTVAKRQRRKLKGYKVVVRRKKGRRKANKRWGKRHRVRTGRKGTISYRRKVKGRSKLYATNPKRRKKRRKSRRRRYNPAKAMAKTLSVKNWTSGLTGLPKNLPAIFSGKMVPKVLSAGAGAVGGIVVGGLVRGQILGLVERFVPGIASNRIVQGALGAAITYSGGYLVGSMVLKGEKKTAFITGAALAAIVNAVMPGQVNRLLTSIPVVGPQLALLPGMNGIGAYVSAPSYQGVGAYVSAPGYQGVGLLPSDAVAGMDDALAGELGAYVSVPGYQGVGMYGSSHLDQ